MNERDLADCLIHVAMQGEAQPMINALGLRHNGSLERAYPAQLWIGAAHAKSIALVTHGIDPTHQCDRLGTETAMLVAHLGIHRIKPRLLINAGTCGGFKSQGGAIGDVYLPTRFLFHDHRMPLPKFEGYAMGEITIADRPELRSAIGAKPGTCSTGSSLDATPDELAFFHRESVTCKDMEAASVANAARDSATQFIAVKVVTDIVEHREVVADEFLRNFARATAQLAMAVDRLLRTSIL
ncbi:MAG: hypothetical protein EXS15_06515 [Phycisphaerales bacterium]|nr:hypothetical protein [Phycisphaerales bacterium]